MSRKPEQKAPDVEPTIRIINQFLKDSGLKVNKIATLAGVDQGNLYRFLNGDRKSVTPAIQKVVDLINKRHNNHVYNDPVILDKKTVFEIMVNSGMKLLDSDPVTLDVVLEFIQAIMPFLEKAIKQRLEDAQTAGK